MRSSDDKTGFTKLDHVTYDIIFPTLTPAEQLVFLKIFRQTVGWGEKETDKISYSQFMKATGYSKKDTITRAVNGLKEKGLITVEGKDKVIKTFSINWEYYENLTVPKKGTAVPKIGTVYG